MSSSEIPDVEEVLAIRDPGEVGRENHGFLDRLMINFGNVVAWAFPLLMVAIVAQVFLRGAGYNQAWLDDAQWWIYGFAMVTGFGYAITTNSHVRVDILHQNFPPEKQARIETAAIGWLLLPFLILMIDVLIHYAWASILAGEGSSSPNGLHNLWILKSLLPLLFALATLAAYAVFCRNLAKITTPTLHKQLLWAFPTVIFLGWRIVHYVAYWVIFLTNDEINPRRISREPFFDHTLIVAVIAVFCLIAVAWLMNRRKA